ncbi:AMP-binding protein [Aquamicrobium segne]|uniref:AMP-binding protein n=1 Tax=Aquamicrobium segne TaxID=469547 RepID=A0ABW0GVN1_9HYPH
MVFILALLAAIALIWCLSAITEKIRLGLSLSQALLYAPFKLFYRICDSRIQLARNAQAPLIYVVTHQSRIDPALMLSLLPDDTLHILDSVTAKSIWMEPWRELARTIAFNAEHVFVSRRLVRALKGKGRLAVYIPANVEPDLRSFRLYRAVIRIAIQANARIVPIFIGGAQTLPFQASGKAPATRHWFPRLKISVLEPMNAAELLARNGSPANRNAHALFDRVAEARLAATDEDQSLFQAVRNAAENFGPGRIALEDATGSKLSYRRLLTGARVLGRDIAGRTRPGESVGIMLPNANATVLALLGIASAGRVSALVNFTAGPANIEAAMNTAVVRIIVSSRSFVEKARLEEIVQALEAVGMEFLWLEDFRASATLREKLCAALLWRYPLIRQDAQKPAVILFTSGSEGLPKAAILSHRNLIANAMQAEARVTISTDDIALNVLPMFHSFGLTAGTLLPLFNGIRLFLYPSPLHYKLIAQLAGRIKPTVMFGTDTFLAQYGRAASDGDFSSLRFAVAGAEAVRDETRKLWRERFGTAIIEGYGLTEAAPVVAVNTAIHGREGTVGRLLPGMAMRIEKVDGVAEGGRLFLAGPNVMMGYMTAERPGELQPLEEGWHDTGDIITVDNEGFITITGRAARFAKIAGEMVPLGILEVLAQDLWPQERHAVISIPDSKRGERIILVTTASKANVESLRKAGKQAGIAPLAIPATIIKVEEIPALGSGKTDYRHTRQLALEELGSSKK